MGTTLDDFRQVLGSPQFWRSALRLAILASVGLAILFIAFTALIVVLPLVLAGALALHLYVRRKLRQARRRSSPQGRDAPLVIDGEYTVVEKRSRRHEPE